MAKFTDEMKDVLTGTMWLLATTSPDGIPNAVPIHCTDILADGRLMLVDNFMSKTLANLQSNPNVSISAWKETTGYQFKGKAIIETSGANFDAGKEIVLKENPKLKPKGVVIVDVDAIYYTSPGPNAGKKVE